MRVVIVEDNLLIAMDLEMQVAGAGHDVVGTAARADDAIEIVRALKPDHVLMDLRLADDTSGADAAEQLYHEDGVRCIFVSGNLDPATRQSLERFDPIAVLSKPIHPQQLVDALKRVG